MESVYQPPPAIWVPRPRWRGDSNTARAASPALARYHWVKIEGYTRTHAWDDLPFRTRQAANEVGHTRKTWSNGYVRVWGIKPQSIIPGDRIGFLTIQDVRDDACTVVCDCGNTCVKYLATLCSDSPLSCGISCTTWPKPNKGDD